MIAERFVVVTVELDCGVLDPIKACYSVSKGSHS